VKRGPHARVKVVAELLVSAGGVAALVWSWRADGNWFDLHVGEEFCVYDPAQLRVHATWRVIGAVVGAVLVLAVRPFVGRWASNRTGLVALRELATLVGAALLALAVSDLVLRAKRKPDPPTLLPPVHDDARYGWAYPPHTATTVRTGERDVVYAIDRRGNRSASEDSLPDLSRPTILIAGESYADGIGVPWDESFAGLLEKRLSIQVIDSAVYAWDHGQAYLRAGDELAALAHPVAVVTTTLPQQLDRDERDADRWHPKFSLRSDGSLEPRPRAPDWWIASPLRKLAHDVVILHDDEPLRVARAIFEETVRAARARGAYPLFLLTNWGPPCLADASGAPSIERRYFDGLDAPHVRVDLDASCEDVTTHHPNARGHELMADAIERALVDARVVERPVPSH